jgi:hypothetical protein
MTPFVRHMLLCDDVQPDAANPRKLNIYGLVHAVRPLAEEQYPVARSFCVYLALTSGRGSGQAQITVTAADDGARVYTGDVHHLRFNDDPLRVVGFLFRIRSCPLWRAGLYWVELRYNGEVIAHQPLTAKEPR